MDVDVVLLLERIEFQRMMVRMYLKTRRKHEVIVFIDPVLFVTTVKRPLDATVLRNTLLLSDPLSFRVVTIRCL
jgi:hypothetical protein